MYDDNAAEIIATTADGLHRVRLARGDYLDDWSNPRRNGSTWLGVLALVGHRRYDLGDDASVAGVAVVRNAMDRTGSWELTARYLRAFWGATVVLPVGLLDHSGLSVYVGGGSHWSDGGGWDSGTVGLAFDTPAGREECGASLEQVEALLVAEVEEYDQYVRGEVYAYVVEEVDGQGDWAAVDECGGFLGEEYARREALATLSDHERFPA